MKRIRVEEINGIIYIDGIDIIKKVSELSKENDRLYLESKEKSNMIDMAINYIDQVIGYEPEARTLDKELNTLTGILMGKEEMIRDLRTESVTIDYELRDILISALRYAIGRKTYITEEVCSYIKEHPELIDERVKTVMLRDLEDINLYYKEDDIDYPFFKNLESWLENLNTEEFTK